MVINNSVIIQYGKQRIDNGTVVTFPISFVAFCSIGFTICAYDNFPKSLQMADLNVTSSFTAKIATDGGSILSQTIGWIAVGY